MHHVTSRGPGLQNALGFSSVALLWGKLGRFEQRSCQNRHTCQFGISVKKPIFLGAPEVGLAEWARAPPGAPGSSPPPTAFPLRRAWPSGRGRGAQTSPRSNPHTRSPKRPVDRRGGRGARPSCDVTFVVGSARPISARERHLLARHLTNSANFAPSGTFSKVPSRPLRKRKPKFSKNPFCLGYSQNIEQIPKS